MNNMNIHMCIRSYSMNIVTRTTILLTLMMLLMELTHTNTSILKKNMLTIICPIFIIDMGTRNSDENPYNSNRDS